YHFSVLDREIPGSYTHCTPNISEGGLMDDPLFQEQTPAEYFKGLVEEALERQRVRATELTSYYLVDLLCRFLRPDQRIPFADDPDEPLALRLSRALESGGMEQQQRRVHLMHLSHKSHTFHHLHT